MIVDSSAIMAVVLGEPDAADFVRAIATAPYVRMSAANWLEAAMVVDGRRDTYAAGRFDEMVSRFKIEIVSVSPEIAQRARRAHQDFGRGNHPARLNYGDCFAYALAKITGEPLLFKGTDFSQTDIQPALRA